jgi:hypothetical protein
MIHASISVIVHPICKLFISTNSTPPLSLGKLLLDLSLDELSHLAHISFYLGDSLLLLV